MKFLEENQIKITVLTPSYNRAHTLPRLYESLLRQKNNRFKWLIVDDGSTDNSKYVIENFDNSKFQIDYVYKKNGGKHTAINVGMKYIDSEYTFIVDSDDYLNDDAIELVEKWIDDIESLDNFAGVAGIRTYSNNVNDIIGEYPRNINYIDCLNSERKKNHLLGDKAEVYKTKLLKEYPFPEYENEKFIPESVIWNEFALMGLKVRWHKESLIICEYLNDGLTAAVNNLSFFEKNIKGYLEDCRINLKVLKFPFNYLAASTFYAKCMAIKRTNCLNDLHLTIAGNIIIKLLGFIRYRIGRY